MQFQPTTLFTEVHKMVKQKNIRIVIADSKLKRTFKKELEGEAKQQLFGKKIGDKFRGELIDMTGFEFEITGGSDHSGFPMAKHVESTGRVKLLLSTGFGFRADKKFKGARQKKGVAGNTISERTTQVNCKIIKWGSIDLIEHFGIKPKEEKKEVISTA